MKNYLNSRFNTAVLALLMLLATSCNQVDSEVDNIDTTDLTETESQTEQTAETNPPHGLPEKDFGGMALRIDSLYENNGIHAEEVTGEVVNDALYNRNAMLMDTYNMKFEIVSTSNGDWQQHSQLISSRNISGDDSFELILGHVLGSANNAINGDYLDLYTVPYLNFDAPWWPAQSVDEMTLYGKMYTICSAITTGQLSAAKVTLFNKDMLTDYQMEVPYEWVRNGQWTLDKLISETAKVYTDINGNGTKDPDDIFGYVTNYSQQGFLVSADIPLLIKTEDGGREISPLTEKAVSYIEKINKLYYETNSTYLTDMPAEALPIFQQQKAAYSFGKIGFTTALRESEFTYGLVPQPKFDETQNEYYVFACPELFSIPNTCSETEFAGFMFEALTYYGYYSVIPVYYETTLQGKIADSPDDVEMLILVNDNLKVSFAYCYDNWEGVSSLFVNGLGLTRTQGNLDIASAYQRNGTRAQTRLDKCLSAFQDN